MACGPDVIFLGLASGPARPMPQPDRPVFYLTTDSDLGVVESVRQNTRAIAHLFGLATRPGTSPIRL